MTRNTYSGTHVALRTVRGPARLTGGCECCGHPAQQWALNPGCADHARLGADSSGGALRFCPDIDHYIAMCYRCHKQIDLADKRRRHAESQS